MTIKATLFFLLFILCFNTFGQIQTGLIKDPEWNALPTYDSNFGSTLDLSNQTFAMVVTAPKIDFGIVNIDNKLVQKWLTPLSGYPLGIGKFKGNILVIAASDKSLLKSYSGSYKAYLLDEKTGKLLSEKVIYESNKSYVEQPEFFFAKDGSYFRMSVRLTLMKRKINMLSIYTGDKDYLTTQNFSVINFDDQLNQREKIDPNMPEGDIWTTSSGTDGSFLIATVDQKGGKINAATYILSTASPLKTVSIPLNLRKGSKVGSISSIASTQALTNYLTVVYTNPDKEPALLTAKINFGTGTFKTTDEVFDNKHVKALEKSFVPVNKDFDDLRFSKPEFLGVKQLTEYGNKLLVSLCQTFVVTGAGTSTIEGATLMNIYDEELKQLYYQFIPRIYISGMGEGSKIAYSLEDNTLRMIGNQRTSSVGRISSFYAEMDFTTGQMRKINEIPGDDIKKGHYANTESVSWLGKTCILPYLDRFRAFQSKLGIQVQLLSF